MCISSRHWSVIETRVKTSKHPSYNIKWLSLSFFYFSLFLFLFLFLSLFLFLFFSLSLAFSLLAGGSFIRVVKEFVLFSLSFSISGKKSKERKQVFCFNAFYTFAFDVSFYFFNRLDYFFYFLFFYFFLFGCSKKEGRKKKQER